MSLKDETPVQTKLYLSGSKGMSWRRLALTTGPERNRTTLLSSVGFF